MEARNTAFPECENCGKENVYSMIDPQCAFVCQDCVNDRPNIKFDFAELVYRKMANCGCGKQGIPNEGNHYWCGAWGCTPGLTGHLRYTGENYNGP